MSTTRQTVKVGNIKIVENSIANIFTVEELEGEDTHQIIYFDVESFADLKKAINLISL